MPSKPLKTQKPEDDSPATVSGPRPGDFALGSVESRAAARAILHQLTDRPQPGDIFIDLSFLTPNRVREVLELVLSHRASEGMLGRQPERIQGQPMMWLKRPEGFGLNAVPKSKSSTGTVAR